MCLQDLFILQSKIIRPFSTGVIKNFINSNFGSSRPEMFCKKGVLRNFAKLTGKHMCWSLFLIKLPKACNFIKKETLARRCFPVNFVKFLRILFFIEHFWWLLLKFKEALNRELIKHDLNNVHYEIFHEIVLSILNAHAPLKKKHFRANHATFVTKAWFSLIVLTLKTQRS